MKFKTYLFLASFFIAILTQSFSAQVRTGDRGKLFPVNLTQINNSAVFVANIPVEGGLQTRQSKQSMKGNMSIQFEVSSAQLKTDVVEVRHLNLVFFDVQQSAISGKDTRNKLGVLGMSIPVSGGGRLKYDTQTQTLSGEIPVQSHFSQMDELLPAVNLNRGKEDDFFVSRTQSGRVSLKIKLSESLERAMAQSIQTKQIGRISGQASASADVEPLQDGGSFIQGYQISVIDRNFVGQYGILQFFESAKNLCVQPVKIRSGASDPTPTGAGLAFGTPGATTQWNKADVTYTIRSTMTVTNAAWKVASSGSEETDIRASVNSSDCIEVFFVENFDPVSLHGGGATWSSGTANAKIISSDGNAVGGVDFTHLAHELGHVIGLGHPGSPGGLYNSSSNTLMCPSGWHNDNPTRNSTDNKNHVSNPLFTFTIKPISAGPDCNLSGDCGVCPPSA